MNYKSFYKSLGELLYAMAAVDGKVYPAEKEKLHELVKEEISTWEKHTDAFGTDTAYYAEFEFERLVDQSVDVEKAYADFIDYVNAYPKSINEATRQHMFVLALKVATAFHGINKTEINFILKLKKDLHLN
ncbi:TerB family tellurite resistance protein [Cytophagales bacterium LB-30]|uniref:TerB family tellurite resistance protein n=1 Tax=Shiella aurantiaca TaxID=3058365 RepID=A0ABT8F1Z6_9BACT|nr:TerB family tellurite resistance protein [Shiella aurantiaca]MDN4164455.1 TerB family tellurite resistance protein [Shiella aurantiaca]